MSEFSRNKLSLIHYVILIYKLYFSNPFSSFCIKDKHPSKQTFAFVILVGLPFCLVPENQIHLFLSLVLLRPGNASVIQQIIYGHTIMYALPYFTQKL